MLGHQWASGGGSEERTDIPLELLGKTGSPSLFNKPVRHWLSGAGDTLAQMPAAAEAVGRPDHTDQSRPDTGAGQSY